MTTKRDYYEILGVSKNATKEEIKQAYRSLALKNHPDRASDSKKKEAEEKFKEISEAYAILADDRKRAQYDQFGHAGIDSRYTYEDIFRGADFGSIFEDLGFGRGIFEDIFSGFDIFGGGGRRRRGPARGSDLEYAMEISFEEAAFGTDKIITIPRYEVCNTCGGEGSKPGTSKITCPDCGGAGQIRTVGGFFSISKTCGHCQGNGDIIKSPCTSCRGSGRVQIERKIQVKIPGGVESGSRLRISGEGEVGSRGGSRGNLYVLIYVKPHEIFERHNNDILCEVPVSFVQAALGAEIRVPTLNGGVEIKIPPGVQSGKIFRLKSKGIQSLHGHGRGDQHVRIIVETPTNLNARQKKMLEEFAKISGEEVNPITTSFLDKVKNLFK